MKKNLIFTLIISAIMLIGDFMSNKGFQLEVVLVRFLVIMAIWNAYDFIKAKRDNSLDQKEKASKPVKKHSEHNKHTNRKKK